MPISSTLAARLGTGGPAPAATRWSPYARHSVPEPQGGRGGAKACPRPALRLNPATERLLGSVQKAALSGSSRRAAPDAAPAAPARPSRGGETASPEHDPKPEPEDGDSTPTLEKRSASGGGGFVFLCALAGHTEVRASSPFLKIRAISTRSRRADRDAISVKRL
jgi:F-box/WD-40 domain protein 7